MHTIGKTPFRGSGHNFVMYFTFLLVYIETVSSSSFSADGSSIDRVNIEQSDEEDGTTVLSIYV